MDNPQFLRDLPSEFEPIRSFLESSLKPYIKITETEVGRLNDDSTGDPLTLWQSKIGGNPYFPIMFEYPVDPVTERFMALLIQLNCADVPQIAGFDFPQHGILQCYLGGMEFADAHQNPEQVRMLYWAEVLEDENELITDFSFIDSMGTIRRDYDDVYALEFSASKDIFWESRYGIELYAPEELAGICGGFHEWLNEYHYEHQTDQLGSKIGGHPDLHSTVDEIEEAAKGRLLLELSGFGCDDYLFLFIEDACLKNRDFSKVEFYHECD